MHFLNLLAIITAIQWRLIKRLNILQLRAIAGAVKQFDPEQHREHQAEPGFEPEVDSVIREIADLLQKESSVQNDTDFRVDMTDEGTIMMWAFKTCG
ncbi:hypothetical protein K469DRAFT_713264 [Zopfia rhizophila CBS 207.26]|uniref:Uncharacterized protein n=1 Tax=Zopfia rhizophila CBS 207.26 TaxID=1314779 RepID=A0A6A6DUJ6_9PEZI|nr:hypothetical protein K469DRAFT_713264 [Zopfia rhizophila CBS 207.26]